MSESNSVLFNVDINNYNGPLDVLLDLAKAQKVDLEEISITKLADQFYEYITNEKAARNDELGYDAYWTKVAPEGAVETAMTEKYGASSLYNTTDWKQMRSSLMRTMGEEARKNHEEGLVNAQSFINKAGSGGAEFYSNFAKEARPTTITGLITNTGFIGCVIILLSK